MGGGMRFRVQLRALEGNYAPPPLDDDGTSHFAADLNSYAHFEGTFGTHVQRMNNSSLKEIKTIRGMTQRQVRVHLKYGACMLTNSASLLVTDNYSTSEALTSGGSRSTTMHDEVNGILRDEAILGSSFLAFHVAGTRLIANGADGFSRIDKDIGRTRGDSADWRRALCGCTATHAAAIQALLEQVLGRELRRVDPASDADLIVGTETISFPSPLTVVAMADLVGMCLNVDVATRHFLVVPRRGQNLWRRCVRGWITIAELPCGGFLNPACYHEPVHIYFKSFVVDAPFLDKYYRRHVQDDPDRLGPMQAMQILDPEWPERFDLRQLQLLLYGVHDRPQVGPASTVRNDVPPRVLFLRCLTFQQCSLGTELQISWVASPATRYAHTRICMRGVLSTSSGNPGTPPGAAPARSSRAQTQHLVLESNYRCNTERFADGLQQAAQIRGPVSRHCHSPHSPALAQTYRQYSESVGSSVRKHHDEPTHRKTALARVEQLHSRIPVALGTGARHASSQFSLHQGYSGRRDTPTFKLYSPQSRISQGPLQHARQQGTASDSIPSQRRFGHTIPVHPGLGGHHKVAGLDESRVPTISSRHQLHRGIEQPPLARDAPTGRIFSPDLGDYFGRRFRISKGSGCEYSGMCADSNNTSDQDRRSVSRLDALAYAREQFRSTPPPVASPPTMDVMDAQAVYEHELARISAWQRRRRLDIRRLLELPHEASAGTNQARRAGVCLERFPRECRPVLHRVAIIPTGRFPSDEASQRNFSYHS